jgi:flagellar biosynthesis/type III secretory pathway protein FliH
VDVVDEGSQRRTPQESDVSETTVVETAPTSTSEAAEAVLDAYESSESDASEPSDSAAAPADPGDGASVPESAPPAPMTVKELTESERLLHEEGFKEARREDGRENRIPYSKVTRIIENGLKKGREAFEAEVTTARQEAQTLREGLTQLREVMSRDPQAFLSELASLDPRYQAFLSPQAPAAPAIRGDTPRRSTRSWPSPPALGWCLL